MKTASVPEPDTTIDPEPPVGERSRFSHLRRLLMWAGTALVTFLVAGALTQVILEWRDGREHPAPGEYVTLEDGRRLHYQLAGTDNDGPLVVLEAGGGSFSPQWAWVQEQISEFAPVLSYDRAGLGWSDPAASTERPADAATTDLFELLAILELNGPRLLVGHSFGAVFARMHAHADPDQVLGAVLVDPAHEDQFERIPQMANQTQLTVMPYLARVGFLRLLGPFDELGDGMPPDAFDAWQAVAYTTRYAAAFRDEGRHVRDVVAPSLTGESTDLGDLPLVIFQAGDAEWPSDEVLHLQEELLHLSSDSRLEVMDGADHSTILTQQHHALHIAEAIRELLEGPE